MDLHHLTDAVLQSVYAIFDDKKFVLDDSFLVEKLSDLAEVLCLQEIAILILQILDKRCLLVDGLILFIDGLEEDIVILREGFNPILELLLREGEQQLVHVVHTVLQIGNGDHEAVARGEQVYSGNLVSEAVDEGLQEGEFVLLADVGLAFGDERTGVGGDEMDPGNQTGVDDALSLLLWDALCFQEPNGFI